MSFCSLTKGITLKICRLCFVLINSILLNFSMFHVFGSYSKYSNLESWKKKEKWNFPSLVHVDLVCFSFSLSGPCGIELYLHQLRHQATVFLHAGQSCCNGHHHHCCFHYSALRYLANKSLETVLSAHTRARVPTHAHTHTHTHPVRKHSDHTKLKTGSKCPGDLEWMMVSREPNILSTMWCYC